MSVEATPASVVGCPIPGDVGAPDSLHTGMRAVVARGPSARSVCAVNLRPGRIAQLQALPTVVEIS